jgi:hypothetical protein
MTVGVSANVKLSERNAGEMIWGKRTSGVSAIRQISGGNRSEDRSSENNRGLLKHGWKRVAGNSA